MNKRIEWKGFYYDAKTGKKLNKILVKKKGKTKVSKIQIISKKQKFIQLSEQYKDERWINLRKSILKRDNYKCVYCGNEGVLHVHHKKYNGYIWQVPESFLITLCEKCHLEKHKRKEFVDFSTIGNELDNEFKAIINNE